MRRLIGSVLVVALAGLALVVVLNRGARTPEAPMSLQGRWHGTLGEPRDSTTVFIDVDTLAGGRWIAEADIPSQDVLDFPLSAEMTGDTVRFQLSRSGEEGPVLAVVLSAGGDELNGTFAQSGTEMPARLLRIGPPAISEELQAMSRDASGKFDVTVLSDDARELREHFNAHADRVRLVLLLSPT